VFVIALSGQNGVPVTDRIVAVGLLTALDVERLGKKFKRLWSIDVTPCFFRIAAGDRLGGPATLSGPRQTVRGV